MKEFFPNNDFILPEHPQMIIQELYGNSEEVLELLCFSARKQQMDAFGEIFIAPELFVETCQPRLYKHSWSNSWSYSGILAAAIPKDMVSEDLLLEQNTDSPHIDTSDPENFVYVWSQSIIPIKGKFLVAGCELNINLMCSLSAETSVPEESVEVLYSLPGKIKHSKETVSYVSESVSLVCEI